MISRSRKVRIDMSGELLVRHCSPTLAGIKTANMFSCSFDSREDMISSIRKLNQALGEKGVRVLPLRFQNNVGLIYVYRPEMLSEDLKRKEAEPLLSERGYNREAPARCLSHLMRRITVQNEFPHEIGLFLGYPPEDVSGFITHHAQDSKFHDYWKVYGDEEQARKRFDSFHRCTRDYSRRWAQGTSVEQLTVAV